MAENNQKERKSMGRSSGYPSFPLEDCVNAVKLVKQELGNSGASRDLVAKAMGYSGVTGASATKISACVHFGLLDRSGNVYILSDLSKKILTPISDKEKEWALVEAVFSPSLYGKLIAAYEGKALPGMLENILSRDYGIIDNSAGKAADVFEKSLEYAGLLHNGVIQKRKDGDRADIDNALMQNELSEPSSLRGEDGPARSESLLAGDDGYFVIELADTGARLVVPSCFSYEISIGEVAEEIKALGDKLQGICSRHEESKNEAT